MAGGVPAPGAAGGSRGLLVLEGREVRLASARLEGTGRPFAHTWWVRGERVDEPRLDEARLEEAWLDEALVDEARLEGLLRRLSAHRPRAMLA